MKTCSRCKKRKSRSEFHKHAIRADGLHPQCKQCRAEYRAKNRDQINENARRRNKDHYRVTRNSGSSFWSAYIRRCRQERVTPSGGPVPWGDVLAKTDGKCADCGATEDLELDHEIPVAAGGEHTLANLYARCSQCNSSKYWTRDRRAVESFRCQNNHLEEGLQK